MVRTALTRTAALAVGVVVLVPLAAGPATAPTDRDYRTDAHAGGLTLTVLGTPVLGASVAESLGRALRGAVLARGSGTGVDGVANPVTATRTSNGTTIIPPTCATPSAAALGLPPALAGALTIGAACGAASAAVAGSVASSTGDASGAQVAVSAEALAKVITDLVVPTITSTLNAAQGPVTQVTAQLTAALTTVCAQIPAPLNAVCASALMDLQAVTKPTAQELLTAITSAVATALKGVDLLRITLGVDRTAVASSSADSGGTASTSALSVTSPSLAFLVKAITAAVTTVLSTYVNAVGDALRHSTVATTAAGLLPGGTSLVGQAADAVTQQLAPPAAAAVTTVVDGLTGALPFLLSNDPILGVQAAASTATASVDRGTGAVTRTAAPGSVTVTLSKALATFLTLPQTTTVAAGQDMALFAGTPLASRIAVGSARDVTATRDGVSVSGKKAEGLTLQLLTTVMGGVDLMAAGVEATAGSVAPVARVARVVEAPAQLPRTGGGTGPAALGGLLLLGAAGIVVARRRTV